MAVEFLGRTVLVTGSAKGLGRQVALDFARQGANVAVHYLHSKKEAQEVANAIRKIGTKAFVLKADVTDPRQAKRLVLAAASDLGGLDILVNNVGGYLRNTVADTTPNEFNSMLESNLLSAFYCTQTALPIMRRRKFGRIVNIGVCASDTVNAKANTVAYSVSKAGVAILTKTTALEQAGSGITVNAVSPGIMENSVVVHKTPMGRLARLDEVSRAVLFFASHKSGYITGQNLEVAGGYNL